MAEHTSRYNIKDPSKQPLLKRSPVQKLYFFLEGKLYKTLASYRAQDLLVAWDFEEEKTAHFLLSDAKRKMKNAYDTAEVAKILNRERRVVNQYVFEGKINSPKRIYLQGKNAYGHPFSRMKWSEDDVLALHEYLLTSGGGRPRKDGIMKPAARIPSRSELLAILKAQPMFYMRTADGDLVPVWSAYDGV
jgi:hypothetical protein